MMKYLKNHFTKQKITNIFRDGKVVKEKLDGFSGYIRCKDGDIQFSHDPEKGTMEPEREGYKNLLSKLEGLPDFDWKSVEFISDECSNLIEYEVEGIFLHDYDSIHKQSSVLKLTPTYFITEGPRESLKELIPDSSLVSQTKTAEKIKKAFGEDFDQGAEGIVVRVDGEEYKITGDFGRLNQKTLGVLPGSFSPPHVGHWELVQSMDHDHKKVIISPQPRKGIGPELTKDIWKEFDEELDVEIAEHDTPVKDAMKYKEIGVGQCEVIKDAGHPFHFGISGTQMREFLEQGEKAKFRAFMPDHLTDEQKEDIFDAVKESASF